MFSELYETIWISKKEVTRNSLGKGLRTMAQWHWKSREKAFSEGFFFMSKLQKLCGGQNRRHIWGNGQERQVSRLEVLKCCFWIISLKWGSKHQKAELFVCFIKLSIYLLCWSAWHMIRYSINICWMDNWNA